MQGTPEWEKYAELLPEGAKPYAGVVLLKYIDHRGHQQVEWAVDVDGCSVQEVSGMLFTTSVEMLQQFIAGALDDDLDEISDDDLPI